MLIFETLLVLLGVCVALALFARKLNVPTAVALVLGGMVMALIPGVPHVVLDPELALALFLPPLLQVSAQRTDWQAFRSHLVPIMLLAIVAVVVTAFAVGVAARFLMPSLSWWPALALGAIVAPPDAVAATSVLRAFRIPKRIVTVLEGESLINDASSLVLYRFAVAATVAGTVSFGHGTASFFTSALGGGAIGAVLAFAVVWVLQRLEDPTLEIMVSMLAGFGSFLLGEHFHVSGVLAAVACGGILGRHQLQLTAKTRVEGQTTWQFVEFVLTSLLFVLIGIQLRLILSHLHRYSVSHLLLVAIGISATLILSRIVIVFATFYPVEGLREALRTGVFAPPLSYPAVISWAGMRGVVSLATALALPEQFPERDLIVFLAFCSILATLVLQGTTLGPLIRHLSVAEDGIETVTPEAVIARKEAATAALDAITGELAESTNRELADKLVDEFKERVESVELLSSDAEAANSQMSEELELRLKAIAAARNKLGERRDELDGETFATLIQELDLEEEQLNVVLSGPTQPI
ncbi:MAG: Na+/H+ antiporter [Janthinobacterium lividum]